MNKIEFEFITKDIQFIHPTMKRKNGDDYYRNLPFRIGNIKLNETESEAIERVLDRVIKDKFLTFSDLSREELLNLLRIVEFDRPNTYPKFNNEVKFSLFNGKYVNPEILSIRWHGPSQTWEYRVRNVGHIYDYHEEKDFKLLE